MHCALFSDHQILIIQPPTPNFQKVSDLCFFPLAYLTSLAFPRILCPSEVRKEKWVKFALEASLPRPCPLLPAPLSTPSLVFRWPRSWGRGRDHGPELLPAARCSTAHMDARAGIRTSPSIHLSIRAPALSLMTQERWLLSSAEKSQVNDMLIKAATVYYYLNK